MLTGSVLAQVIPILGSLVIARLFAPVEFGIFAAWFGGAILLAVMVTGRFETALAIEADGEPRRLAVIATLLTAVVGSSVALVLLASARLIAPTVFTNLPTALIVALVPAGFVIAVANIWQAWAVAEGRYRTLSFMRIVQAGAVTLIQIVAGMLGPSATTLALAYIFGVCIGLILSVYLMPLGRLPHGELRATVVVFWRRQRRFPIFSLPADTINTAAAQLPVLIIASRFGAETAGLLAMAMRILGAPIGLLGKSVLDVFKRHAATSYRERGECRSEYLRTFKVLATGSLVFCIAMAFLSETIFALAFGEQWRAAGTIAVWLLPLFALRFMASPLSYMVYIAGKQHLDLFWQIALLGVTFLCLWIPQGHELALQAYSAGYSMLYVVYLAMSYRFSLGVKS